jgi:signal transduction histidine kinase
MQTTLASSAVAADKGDGYPAIHKLFDPQLATDHVIFNRNIKQLVPRVTQHNPALLAERSRIEELIAADRHKDEFLAVLCHELRSPLGSIQNAVEILRRHSGEDPSLRQKMHALIERQLRHMRLLAEDLLDVSRITCGQLRLQRERIDLCVILRNAIETLEADISQRKHKLTTTWPDVPILVDVDVRRLEQVFVNLLGNAAKYTESNGELALSVSACDGQAEVRVRDSGMGIAHDVLPHIFDLFVQADQTAPSSRSGLGVGLALVHMIIQRHGGSVTAASAGLGRGSEFTVRLAEST